MLLHFLQWKLAATMLYSLFKWNGLCYSRLNLFATAKWFLTTWLVLWKVPDAVLVRYAATIPNKLCSLFVVCFHLFQPTTEHRSGYKRRWTKNSRLEAFFSEIPRVPFESFALGFCLAFSSNRPNLVWNDQKNYVNSVIMSKISG